MLIDRIKKKVETAINTDGRGNFNPTEFNLFLHDSIQSRNEEYFHDLNRLINKQNRGLITNALDNTPDRFREKASHYLVEDVASYTADGVYDYPKDFRYFNTLGADENQYEYCSENRKWAITKKFANAKNPIFTMVNNKFKVYPIPATQDNLPITYLRTVKFPKWTYVAIGEGEVFNPSAPDFQDADIHPSEEDEMVMRVLLKFGINLKEQDVQQFAQAEERNEFNQTLKQ